MLDLCYPIQKSKDENEIMIFKQWKISSIFDSHKEDTADQRVDTIALRLVAASEDDIGATIVRPEVDCCASDKTKNAKWTTVDPGAAAEEEP